MGCPHLERMRRVCDIPSTAEYFSCRPAAGAMCTRPLPRAAYLLYLRHPRLGTLKHKYLKDKKLMHLFAHLGCIAQTDPPGSSYTPRQHCWRTSHTRNVPSVEPETLTVAKRMMYKRYGHDHHGPKALGFGRLRPS